MMITTNEDDDFVPQKCEKVPAEQPELFFLPKKCQPRAIHLRWKKEAEVAMPTGGAPPVGIATSASLL